MSPLYLRYRNSPTDPWSLPPTLSSVIPGLPGGTLPLESFTLATGPQLPTPYGYTSADPYIEDYYGMEASLLSIPQSLMRSVATYILQFKEAAYSEAMHSLFASGAFVTAGLSELSIENIGGRSAIRFRIASAIVDII